MSYVRSGEFHLVLPTIQFVADPPGRWINVMTGKVGDFESRLQHYIDELDRFQRRTKMSVINPIANTRYTIQKSWMFTPDGIWSVSIFGLNDDICLLLGYLVRLFCEWSRFILWWCPIEWMRWKDMRIKACRNRPVEALHLSSTGMPDRYWVLPPSTCCVPWSTARHFKNAQELYRYLAGNHAKCRR